SCLKRCLTNEHTTRTERREEANTIINTAHIRTHTHTHKHTHPHPPRTQKHTPHTKTTPHTHTHTQRHTHTHTQTQTHTHTDRARHEWPRSHTRSAAPNHCEKNCPCTWSAGRLSVPMCV